MEQMKKCLAEGVGTLVLVFMGCGSAIVLGAGVPGGHLAVALAFGLSIVAMAYVIGNISGCHINPAVSLALFLDKRMSAPDFGAYVIAQIIGALLGALLLQFFVSLGIQDATGALATNSYTNVKGVMGGLIIEIILTFIFIFTILGVTSDTSKAPVAGLVIGLTLTFVHIVGIPLTGASVNPARSLGPALLVGGQAIQQVWVFIVGPLIGSLLAVLIYRLCKKGSHKSH